MEARMGRTVRPGYSLIEVLWIMGLVSFLLAGMGEILLRSFQAARSADDTVKKTALLAAALESLKTKSFGSADLSPGEYAKTVEPVAGGKETRSEWRIEQTAPGLKKVEYGLYFGGESDRAIRAALLISEALGF
jgi:type II secretory pathway pseudopilin PulG